MTASPNLSPMGCGPNPCEWLCGAKPRYCWSFRQGHTSGGDPWDLGRWDVISQSGVSVNASGELQIALGGHFRGLAKDRHPFGDTGVRSLVRGRETTLSGRIAASNWLELRQACSSLADGWFLRYASNQFICWDGTQRILYSTNDVSPADSILCGHPEGSYIIPQPYGHGRGWNYAIAPPGGSTGDEDGDNWVNPGASSGDRFGVDFQAITQAITISEYSVADTLTTGILCGPCAGEPGCIQTPLGTESPKVGPCYQFTIPSQMVWEFAHDPNDAPCCAVYDGTYVLQQLPGPSPPYTTCTWVWQGTVPGGCNGYEQLEVRCSLSTTGNLTVTMRSNDPFDPQLGRWDVQLLPSPLNCLTIDEQYLPSGFGGGLCLTPSYTRIRAA